MTRAGDLDDHFLQPGETVALQGRRLATIGAESDACVSVEAVPSAGALQALKAALQ